MNRLEDLCPGLGRYSMEFWLVFATWFFIFEKQKYLIFQYAFSKVARKVHTIFSISFCRRQAKMVQVYTHFRTK